MMINICRELVVVAYQNRPVMYSLLDMISLLFFLGSMPPHSKTIFEEGAVFKSFKLVKGGIFQEDGMIDYYCHLIGKIVFFDVKQLLIL